MADKLRIYNASLLLLGERRLASLTEAREPRRVLDDVYSDALLYCLEQGQWNFAMRSVQVESDAAVDPAFGFTYAFEKPDDWIRTCGLSASETFSLPLMRYLDEAGYWYSDVAPVYVRYVSSDTNYGADLSLWPMTFTRFFEAHLAFLASERITQAQSKTEGLMKIERVRKSDALSKDAMNEPTAFPPRGSWASAVLGGGSSSRYGR